MVSPVYRVSKQLRHAICTLFEDPSQAYQFLGASRSPLDSDWYEEPLSAGQSSVERARCLLARLEGYIVQMSAECVELGSETETERLRSEATGLLIALRELARHFPEIRDL